MKYENRKVKRMKDRIASEGDDNGHPYDRMQKNLNKHLTLYSHGGVIERSHSKRVGDIVNKSIENRYDAASKALKRIKNRREHHASS